MHTASRTLAIEVPPAPPAIADKLIEWTFAAVHIAGYVPSATFGDVRYCGAIGGQADIRRR
jgi:hypothetical protein